MRAVSLSAGSLVLRLRTSSMPAIAPIMDKVAKVHGPRDEDLLELADAFHALATSLLPHVDDEEEVLFPALMAGAPDLAIVKRELGMYCSARL